MIDADGILNDMIDNLKKCYLKYNNRYEKF